MYKDKFISAVITAAGMGSRMGFDIPKLEIIIEGTPIINFTVKKFEDLGIFDEIIIVTNELLIEKYKKRFAKENIKVVLGGKTREESTFNGLKNLDENSYITVCHDGARPFVEKDTIINSIETAIKSGAAIAAVKSKDTIKTVKDMTVVSTPDRNFLYQIQTPQSFKTALIVSAYEKFFGKINATDDSAFVENLNFDVKIVEGSYNNIKITTKEDLIIARALLEEK